MPSETAYVTPSQGYAPILALKYKTRVDSDDNDQHFSLLKYWINYDNKKFYDTSPQEYEVGALRHSALRHSVEWHSA